MKINLNISLEKFEGHVYWISWACVIPAKECPPKQSGAGIYSPMIVLGICHSCEGRNPFSLFVNSWIDSCLRRSDNVEGRSDCEVTF